MKTILAAALLSGAAVGAQASTTFVYDFVGTQSVITQCPPVTDCTPVVTTPLRIDDALTIQVSDGDGSYHYVASYPEAVVTANPEGFALEALSFDFRPTNFGTAQMPEQGPPPFYGWGMYLTRDIALQVQDGKLASFSYSADNGSGAGVSLRLEGLSYLVNASQYWYVPFTSVEGRFVPAVPEPQTWALLVLGLVATGLAGRRAGRA